MRVNENAYTRMIDRHEKETNELPIGWAFGTKQFEEMMNGWGLDPEKDTDKLYKLPGGGFIQKKDSAHMHEVLDRHVREMNEAIATDTTGEGFIFHMFVYELENHEYSYTMDVEETLDALGFTFEEVANSKPLSHGLGKARRYVSHLR